MKNKEFYQFFLTNKSLSDDELASKLIAKFGLKHSKALVKDHIQTTRKM